MRFQVLPVGNRPRATGPGQAFLVSDNWDDWFKFSTLFHLHVTDQNGVPNHIGMVKIGQFDMKEGQRSPGLPQVFKELDASFFSLGQGDDYYTALTLQGDSIRDEVLRALRDVAADADLFEKALREDVTTTSLLRSVTATTVRRQLRRMAKGGARLSRYAFSYTSPLPKQTGVGPIELSFEVEPDSFPPSNIHVLIGRNGVGKTHLLGNMTDSLLELEQRDCGSFRSDDDEEHPFANIVSVSFSAFDEFDPIPDRRVPEHPVGYAYAGLKRTSNRGGERGTPKSPKMLESEFVSSLRECLLGPRRARWERAIAALQADPVFREADVASLGAPESDEKAAASLFRRLSSGHKIILLTTTKLVELVEERTLVMLDEPEAHLHPPLLAAFIRALSDMLIDRNGVALVATHSPVVLQEVPKGCAWVLRRTGLCTSAERPAVETFGENVGVLTREVFGLELTHSGYHGLLQRSVLKHKDYEAVIGEFGGHVGAEARALVRALVDEAESGV